MDYLSERSKTVDASAIRKVWQMAVHMKDPANFSIGEPDFPTPQAIKQAAVQAILNDKNTYTLTAGIDPLRQKLAERITNEFQWKNPGILVTSGLSGALLLILMATVNPGDEVLIPDPFFVSYRHLTNLFNGKCLFIDTYPDFALSAEKLEAMITPKSKILILNSPSNPSGAVYSQEQLKAVAALARKHHLLVISDEIYRDFSYDQPAASIAQYYENTLIMRGMSKSYGIPGWRMGYISAPEHLSELMDKFITLQQYTFVCAPHPFQIAAITALDCDMSEQIEAYKAKRDLIYNGLKEKFNLVKPGGAFYAFVPVPGGDATAFVTKAIANNVLIIPGQAFSQRNSHFRISYATKNEKILQGIERLNQLV